MKLIGKDAVVAIIESLLDKGRYHEEYDCAYRDGNNGALYALKGKVNSLEVKGVDIEKEVIDWWNAHYSSKAYTFEGYTGHYVENSTLIEIAKHFFELGVNASNPLTWEDIKLIWNITDEMDNMPEEEFYKEVLKRFKEKKGKRNDIKRH